jgi:hypothetical protein
MKDDYLIDYHKKVLEADPVAGRELIRLNEDHLRRAIGENPEKKMPTKAVRKLKKNSKKNR